VTVLGVNLLVTLLLLAILEGGSRLVNPVAIPTTLVFRFEPGWEGRSQYDRLLFWRMRPGIEHDGEIYTNSLGLRGPEIPAKQPGEYRILSLGESTTFARRLPYEKSYSARLEAELAPLVGGEVRVVNAGVPGYTSFQGYQYLRHTGISLEPDAVLIYFGFNDFLPISYRISRESESLDADAARTDRQLFAERQSLSFRLTDLLLRYSNLAKTILLRGQGPDAGITSLSGRVRVPAQDRRWALEAFRRFCQEHQIQLVVVIPWYREFADHIPLLRELADWEDVTLVDLPGRLAGYDDTRSDWFIDEVHPTAEGHDLISDEIAKAFRERILETTPPEPGPVDAGRSMRVSPEV
jgi:lysophospholipase L1-like esterase